MPKKKPKLYAKYPQPVRRMLMRRDAEIERLTAITNDAQNMARYWKRQCQAWEASVATAVRRAAETMALPDMSSCAPTGCCGEYGPQTFPATVTVDPSVAHLFTARPTPTEVQAGDSEPAPATEVVRGNGRVSPIEAWHVAIMPFYVWPIVQSQWLDHGGERIWAWGDLLPDPNTTNVPFIPPLSLTLPQPQPAPWPVRLWRRLVGGESIVHAPSVPDSLEGRRAVLWSWPWTGGSTGVHLIPRMRVLAEAAWFGRRGEGSLVHDPSAYPAPAVTWRAA